MAVPDQQSDGLLPEDLLRRMDRTRLFWLLPALVVVASTVIWSISYGEAPDGDRGRVVPIHFGIFLSVLFAALPFIVCLVQNVSRRWQLLKLQTFQHLPVADTALYNVARTAIGSLRLAVDPDYGLVLALFFLVSFFGFLAIFVVDGDNHYLINPSVLLGGLEDRFDSVKFEEYQLQTFCVVALAFIGSYLHALIRTVNRINNNDLTPTVLCSYVIRIIAACTVAAVLRHVLQPVADAAGLSAGAGPLLLLIGFIVGLTPDFFIAFIGRQALLKIRGTRRDVGDYAVPSSLSLSMIDDLSHGKIDRLKQLGIDNAQVLARQNPFLLLAQLQVDLATLIDWIGQAQLYVLVRGGLTDLRTACVRDIFDLHTRLADKGGRSDICRRLKLRPAIGGSLLVQLEQDPSFLRLRQIRDAMAPSEHWGWYSRRLGSDHASPSAASVRDPGAQLSRPAEETTERPKEPTSLGTRGEEFALPYNIITNGAVASPAPGAQRSADEARYINAWVEDGAPQLKKDRPYRLAVNIGRRRERASASIALRDPAWDKRAPLNLIVAVSGRGFTVDLPQHDVALPCNGDTAPVFFALTPLQSADFQLRIGFYRARDLALLQELEIPLEVQDAVRAA